MRVSFFTIGESNGKHGKRKKQNVLEMKVPVKLNVNIESLGSKY